MTELELINNIKQVLRSAELVYNDGDFTSATILYFKALFTILDFILLKNIGRTPKDHTERFRMLETNYSDLYEFTDKYFGVYRSTYSSSVDKKTCNDVRENVSKIIKKYKIPV